MPTPAAPPPRARAPPRGGSPPAPPPRARAPPPPNRPATPPPRHLGPEDGVHLGRARNGRAQSEGGDRHGGEQAHPVHLSPPSSKVAPRIAAGGCEAVAKSLRVP